MDQIRQNLGLCPQHSILYDELTVKEHLLFFAAVSEYVLSMPLSSALHTCMLLCRLTYSTFSPYCARRATHLIVRVKMLRSFVASMFIGSVKKTGYVFTRVDCKTGSDYLKIVL